MRRTSSSGQRSEDCTRHCRVTQGVWDRGQWVPGIRWWTPRRKPRQVAGCCWWAALRGGRLGAVSSRLPRLIRGRGVAMRGCERHCSSARQMGRSQLHTIVSAVQARIKTGHPPFLPRCCSAESSACAPRLTRHDCMQPHALCLKTRSLSLALVACSTLCSALVNPHDCRWRARDCLARSYLAREPGAVSPPIVWRRRRRRVGARGPSGSTHGVVHQRSFLLAISNPARSPASPVCSAPSVPSHRFPLALHGPWRQLMDLVALSPQEPGHPAAPHVCFEHTPACIGVGSPAGWHHLDRSAGRGRQR